MPLEKFKCRWTYYDKNEGQRMSLRTFKRKQACYTRKTLTSCTRVQIRVSTCYDRKMRISPTKSRPIIKEKLLSVQDEDVLEKFRVLTGQHNNDVLSLHSQLLSKPREVSKDEENINMAVEHDKPDSWELEVPSTEEEKIRFTCGEKIEEGRTSLEESHVKALQTKKIVVLVTRQKAKEVVCFHVSL